MYIIQSAVAGTAGTFVMTLFMNLGSKATRYDFHVPSILGSMLLMSTRPSGKPSKSINTLIIGYIAHYLIGIVFALVYAQIFGEDKLVKYGNALLFGLVAGLLAAGFWFCAFKIHPLAPRVNLGLYLTLIFIGHLIFSFGMVTVFRLMH